MGDYGKASSDHEKQPEPFTAVGRPRDQGNSHNDQGNLDEGCKN